MTNKVLHNQSLLDFLLHHCGSMEGIVDIALENNISITDALVPGSLLSIPSNIVIDTDIIEFYSNKNIIPACGFPANQNQDQDNLDYVFPYELPASL